MEIAACRWGEKIFMSNQKYSETLFISNHYPNIQLTIKMTYSSKQKSDFLLHQSPFNTNPHMVIKSLGI